MSNSAPVPDPAASSAGSSEKATVVNQKRPVWCSLPGDHDDIVPIGFPMPEDKRTGWFTVRECANAWFDLMKETGVVTELIDRTDVVRVIQLSDCLKRNTPIELNFEQMTGMRDARLCMQEAYKRKKAQDAKSEQSVVCQPGGLSSDPVASSGAGAGVGGR